MEWAGFSQRRQRQRGGEWKDALRPAGPTGKVSSRAETGLIPAGETARERRRWTAPTGRIPAGVRLLQQVGIPVGEPPGSELRSAVTAEADSGPGNSGGDGWDSGPAISG
jgi:hypothetical protein